MKYRRANGFVIKKSAGYVVFKKILGTENLFLNNTSLLIYSLTDGLRTKDEIKRDTIAFLQDADQFNELEFENGIEQLLNLGVIEPNVKNIESLPLVSLAFMGFPNSFDESDNYFIRALLNHFTPFFVNIYAEEPNLIFINDADSFSDYDSSTQNSISFGVLTHGEQLETNRFDFLITTDQTEEFPNHFYLPSWALRLNLGTQFLSDELGEVIYNFLNTYIKDVTIGDYYFNYKQNNLAKISNYSNLAKGKLTIGMATYDDFDGPYFTMQSIRLHHKEIADKLEFIIIHNNPVGPVADALKSLQSWIPNYRYIPYDEYNGTAVRDLIFREANTEYVMSIDSHVIIEGGAVSKLISYLDEVPESLDLYQGPMLYDDINSNSYASSFAPEWRSGMYGTWKKDEAAANEDSKPFEIPMQGLGLFVCRRAAWLGFNPRFRGFGGEEGYIHEKFRQNGNKTICLPFLRWLHRFNRPGGIKYPNLWKDRIRNYMIGFKELGWDTSAIEYHFSELLGEGQFNIIFQEVKSEISNPFQFFDTVYVLIPNDSPKEEKVIKDHINSLGMGHLVRYYKFDKSGYPGHYYNLHRELCNQCIKFGFDNVFIIEDRAILNGQLEDCIKDATENLNELDWYSIEIAWHKVGLYTSTVYNYMHEIPLDPSPSCFMYGFNFKHTYQLSWEINESKQKRKLALVKKESKSIPEKAKG